MFILLTVALTIASIALRLASFNLTAMIKLRERAGKGGKVVDALIHARNFVRAVGVFVRSARAVCRFLTGLVLTLDVIMFLILLVIGSSFSLFYNPF